MQGEEVVFSDPEDGDDFLDERIEHTDRNQVILHWGNPPPLTIKENKD